MTPSSASGTHRARWGWGLGAVLAVMVVLVLAMMWWWDTEPSPFAPDQVTRTTLADMHAHAVPGAETTITLMHSVDTLLDKRGGYLSNDVLPPGVFMDNVPHWEYGVLTASRDLVRAMRNDFSRSQAQSTEDADLAKADPLLSSPNNRWLLPSSESQYGKAVDHLRAYLKRLTDGHDGDANFYARADNLADYLQVASSRLGSLSQRLSASVGQIRLDESPGNGAPPSASTSAPAMAGADAADTREQRVKTPWSQIDDNFYEARGYTWALLVQLKAFRHDFAPVLRDKQARISLDQVIRELEEAQHPLGSPVVLNGSPFGLFANHSLVMANYISRANAALIDLRELLRRG
ncbi:DUF2333 family protein [Oleiagrimonas sp. C23AA]|uniref:DUF2333 family protein n=1 Tax=Oleiagrimonas sp. C23AA TaxID=2719047 RepID=UPI001F0D7F32|nr:DUF2333 family protein [Oleiagrimonas sp. C23AA]